MILLYYSSLYCIYICKYFCWQTNDFYIPDFWISWNLYRVHEFFFVFRDFNSFGRFLIQREPFEGLGENLFSQCVDDCFLSISSSIFICSNWFYYFSVGDHKSINAFRNKHRTRGWQSTGATVNKRSKCSSSKVDNFNLQVC